MERDGWVAGARWLVLAAMLAAGLAEAHEVGGVKMPDTLELQDHRLELAHMELKRKLFFDIYVWGLYMEQIPRLEAEAIATDSIKRLHFRFLRNIRKDQLVGAFRQGLSINPALRSGPLQQEMEKLLQSLKDVKNGDDLILTYEPNAGLKVSGEASGGVVIPGKCFADALFTAWLQKNPVFPR
ncbi:MAG: chalcone isomerase family protein [Hyalangium sp.]|uniref:chalcone isomerase family protein n=1 Tax=Hyalangium sp. TaxID=2028555 RepID=UPI00389B1E17